ncbi:MAG: cytochrome c, partial [Armatimonadetes bacterium]|nr:cytochrome c [Armatimonadota bacterium]NIO96893.1 cytochrome c [Armatimonadota bacterium]
KERMDGMGVMKESMKVLTAMMQGQTPYDAEVIREEANKIAALSGEAMTKLFPEGSNDKPSEAKSEVWSNWEEFTSLAEQLGGLAEGLALAA